MDLHARSHEVSRLIPEGAERLHQLQRRCCAAARRGAAAHGGCVRAEVDAEAAHRRMKIARDRVEQRPAAPRTAHLTDVARGSCGRRPMG